MIFAVLATGPSMSQAVADSVRGRCKVIAVSDSWQLAPWADALVSSDAGWWRHSQPEFAGPKYTLGSFPDVEKVEGVAMGTNSGLLGIHVAVKLGATKVLLLGVDMHGTHFFGPHLTLRNTRPARMEVFHRQFADYKPRGVEILNCNPASRLTCYPMARLEDHLESLAKPETPDCRADRSVQDRPSAAGVRRRVRMHAAPRRPRPAGVVEPDQGRRDGGHGV